MAEEDAFVPPPAWVRVDGLPPVCNIEVARDPGAALEPLDFEACPGLERCRQFVADFPEHPRGVPFQVQPHASFVDAERILFTYRLRMLIGARDFDYFAVVSATGEHVAVVRSPPLPSDREGCSVTELSPADETYVFEVTYHRPSRAGYWTTHILRAPYAAPADVERLWRGDGPTAPAFVQSIEVSDSVVGMFTPIPIEVLRVDAAGATVTLCAAEPGAPYCKLDEAVGGSLLSSHDRGGWWVAIASAGDTRFRPLIDLPDSDDASPRSDGTDLVWMRGFDPVWTQPTRFELWASPFAETPEGLVPRRIAGVTASGFINRIGVGNGRAWIADRVGLSSEEFYYAIYDLESGERRTYRFSGDEGLGFAGPVLGRDEVAIPIHPAPPDDYRLTRTVRFIEYDALPLEPTP